MPPFKAGTTFLDHRAANIQGEKAKYFIGMNNADDEDDVVVAFFLTLNNIEWIYITLVATKRNRSLFFSQKKLVISPLTLQ